MRGQLTVLYGNFTGYGEVRGLVCSVPGTPYEARSINGSPPVTITLGLILRRTPSFESIYHIGMPNVTSKGLHHCA